MIMTFLLMQYIFTVYFYRIYVILPPKCTFIPQIMYFQGIYDIFKDKKRIGK